MKRTWQTLLGAGCVLTLAAIISACNFPSLGSEETGSSAVPANTDRAATIFIPGGTFWMGSESSDPLADADEQPYHQVTLAGFSIYTHEVTNGMYAACVAAGGCVPVDVLSAGGAAAGSDPALVDHPVTGVDWNMAQRYCTWANSRLPTEAEWELAARGLDSLAYPWGTEAPDCEHVNMLGCLVPPATLANNSLPAGSSPFGLTEMSGNAWEWVNDWYDEDYYALSPETNPLGPYFGELKVARGGGMKSEPAQMRAAARIGGNPYRSYDDVGFRCVTGTDLLLPNRFATPDDRHEMIPPDPLDPGEDIEDPVDPDTTWYSTGEVMVSCPNPEGRMHIFVEADTSEPVTYSVEVNGAPFDCYYDEMLRGLQCEGPIPDNNDELDHYTIDVHFNPGGIGHLYPDRPTECSPDVTTVWMADSSASCPDGGWITLTFIFDPPVVWESVTVDEAEIPCWSAGPTQTDCIVPARPAGENLHVDLFGFDAEDRAYFWNAVVLIPEDCPAEAWGLHVSPICFEDEPAVEVAVAAGPAALDDIWVGAVELDCIGMAPGVYICGNLPGDPGAEIVMTTCVEGLGCGDRTVTIPECPGTEAPITYDFESGCYPSLGPVVVIDYFPADLDLVAANANGADLTCVGSPEPGMYMCYTLPGSPGSEMTITGCLADGYCFSDPIIVQDCDVEESTTGEWILAALRCADSTTISFVLDTGMAWLIPGAGYTYSASDDVGAYSCVVDATVPGRLYCTGTSPGSPGILQVCIQQDGAAAPTCQYFPDWSTWVADIPPCGTIPGEPVVTCPDHTTQGACVAAGCRWDKGPPDGLLHCYNP